MDLTTLAMVGTVVSAGNILYKVGEKVADMLSDDEPKKEPTVLSGLTPEGENNAKAGETKGGSFDFSA